MKRVIHIIIVINILFLSFGKAQTTFNYSYSIIIIHNSACNSFCCTFPACVTFQVVPNFSGGWWCPGLPSNSSWNFGDGTSSGYDLNDTITHCYSTQGSYLVEHTSDGYASGGVHCHGYGSTTYTVKPACVFGIDQLTDIKNSIKIYPNPTSGEFIFDAKENKGRITIYNTIGEKVFEANAENNPIKIKLQTSGVYHLCFTTQEGVYTRKIVVSE